WCTISGSGPVDIVRLDSDAGRADPHAEVGAIAETGWKLKLEVPGLEARSKSAFPPDFRSKSSRLPETSILKKVRLTSRLWLCGGLLLLAVGGCAHRRDERAPEARPTIISPNDSEVDAALLRAATEALGEREGCILIMEPGNGRIRAVVNPRLAYEQAFPPGSTIKAFTSLAAMRTGLIDSHSAIRCAGQYSTKEFSVVCSHPKSEAPFDLPQALAYSCNFYFAKTAERLSNGVFQSTLAGFGFGARTGVAGSESAGRVPGPEWNIKTALGEG